MAQSDSRMAEVAGADPAGAGLASAPQGLDQDICEVERLLALSQRPIIAHRLAMFLSELQQVTAPIGLVLERRGNTPHRPACLTPLTSVCRVV